MPRVSLKRGPDGRWRMADDGWKNADDKNADGKMRIR